MYSKADPGKPVFTSAQLRGLRGKYRRQLEAIVYDMWTKGVPPTSIARLVGWRGIVSVRYAVENETMRRLWRGERITLAVAPPMPHFPL